MSAINSVPVDLFKRLASISFTAGVKDGLHGFLCEMQIVSSQR